LSIINELIDVVMNNPIEAFLLLAFSVFAYKFFLSNDYLARSNRHGFKRWLTRSVPLEIEYFFRHLLINNPYSYCNLQHQYFEEVLELIRITPFMHNWNSRDFIKAKLNIPESDVSRIINALRDLGIIEFDDDNHIVLTSQHSNVKVNQ